MIDTTLATRWPNGETEAAIEAYSQVLAEDPLSRMPPSTKRCLSKCSKTSSSRISRTRKEMETLLISSKTQAIKVKQRVRSQRQKNIAVRRRDESEQSDNTEEENPSDPTDQAEPEDEPESESEAAEAETAEEALDPEQQQAMEQWLKRVPMTLADCFAESSNNNSKIGFDEATSPAKTLKETGNPMRLILTVILFWTDNLGRNRAGAVTATVDRNQITEFDLLTPPCESPATIPASQIPHR